MPLEKITVRLLSAAVLGLCAASLATPVFAADWIYVTESSSGTVFYYDASTIQRTGNQVTVWEKWDLSRDKTQKERQRTVRGRFDCAQRTFTLLNTTEYYPDGHNSSHSWEANDRIAEPVAPETVLEAKLDAVCAATAP